MEVIKDTIAGLMRQWQSKKDESRNDNPEILLQNNLSKKELKHVRIKYFYKGILGISVDSSTWLYYLSLKKQHLVAQLQRESPSIKGVRFTVADFTEKANYEKEKKRSIG